MTKIQIDQMVRRVFDALKSNHIITFKANEERVIDRATQLVEGDFSKEQELDKEVHRMMDDLEKQNPNSFQRHKMFGMLKKRLAKEKGIVL